MASVNLAAQPRTKVGKQGNKSLRREGFVPAILYGHGMKPLSLQLQEKALWSALHTKAGENVVLNLKVEGVQLKESMCLVKEVQHNPVTDKIQHVDLTVVSMTEKIDVKVPLVVKNQAEAPGVKEGGVLDIIHHEIEVECLPTDIPEKIEVDAKGMKIDDAIHAKDLNLPKGVTLKLAPEDVVVALHPPMKEEAVTEEAAPGEPEVIEKGKKIEGEEGAAAPAPAAAPAAKKPDKKE
jgi:large subunit ribosomal protein L25